MRWSMSRWIGVSCLASLIAAAIVWACGAPPPSTPPPPPPDPPIVCCVVIDRFPDPDNPGREILIVRYFRQDGRPLYQSNPMPLLPSQQCLCVVPNLPTSAILAGVAMTGLSFGDPTNIPWQGLPPNIPGYGPFVRNTSLTLISQANQFFNGYAAVTGGTVTPPPNPDPNTLWTFAGPGNIPPNSFFDVFVELNAPFGFDPTILCIPGQMWMIGLFLVNGTQVLSEPIQPGLPPIAIGPFLGNPGSSAFYKFKWYPSIVPPPCPPVGGGCVSDVDDGSGTGTPDGATDIADLLYFLFRFDLGC